MVLRAPSRPHPRSRFGVIRRILVISALVATAAQGQPGQQPVAVDPTATGPFEILDNVEGDRVDLLFMPVDPMVLSPDGSVLFAVNSHGSTVQRFEDLTGDPTATFDVPWGPVSIAYWTSNVDQHEELLVVTRGTYGLTRLDPDTGAVLGWLELPAEPAGVVVDEVRDHLFVACSAQDRVVEIDLQQNTVYDTFEIDTTRHLLFLTLEDSGDVIVTPMLSGNNTIARPEPLLADLQADIDGFIADLADPAVGAIDLPDHDAFRLIPGTTPGSGTVEVVARALGTNVFDTAINPVTGQFWALNTEANNRDPDQQNEPALNGEVVFNRITITDLPAPGQPPAQATDHTVLVLDDQDPTTPDIDYADDFSIGKPYALWFDSAGNGTVVGALTDNLRILDEDGDFIAQWDLTPGSIPRDVIYVEELLLMLVYCWGTNVIEVYDLGDPQIPLVAELELGYDPAPPIVREGRQIFYDGHNSLHENQSCESCHLEVGLDFLVWNLSDWPVDDKGPMFTQNLRGIETTLPYHWRGERSFLDFNPAFSGLLGGENLETERDPELPDEPSEFEKFQAFVFDVVNPANPFEHERRVVTNDVSVTEFVTFDVPPHADLSALDGQQLYFDVPTVGTATCNDCHQLPTGTDNDMFHDGLADQGHRSSFVVPAYNGMWRKEQKSRVDTQLVGSGVDRRPPLGSGSSHAGLVAGVFEFVNDLFPPLRPAERQDVAHFLHQIDSGLAPAVHRAALLDAANLSAEQEIDGYLIDQVRLRNADLAVFGTVDLGNGPEPMRWYYDRALAAFVAEDGTEPTRPLGFFVSQAQAGTGSNLFVGLPVGMGRRWGVDYDGDLVLNVDEEVAQTDPHDEDSDDDGFLDGTELTHMSDPNDDADLPNDTVAPSILDVRLMFVTARVAKLIVETDVPTRLETAYSGPGVASGQVDSAGWTTLHTVVLRDLVPSYTTTGTINVYGGTVTAFDEAGNRDVETLPTMQTESFITATEGTVPTETIIGALDVISAAPEPSGGYRMIVDARVDHKKIPSPSPQLDHVVVARVLLNGERSSDFTLDTSVPPVFMQWDAGIFGLYFGIGPFLLGSVSGTDGISRLEFVLPNAAPGDTVQVSIEWAGQVDPATFDPSVPLFLGSSVYDFPTTPTAQRATVPRQL